MRVFSNALDQFALPQSWLPFTLGILLSATGFVIYSPDPEINITVVNFGVDDSETIYAYDSSGSMQDEWTEFPSEWERHVYLEDEFQFSMYEQRLCSEGQCCKAQIMLSKAICESFDDDCDDETEALNEVLFWERAFQNEFCADMAPFEEELCYNLMWEF